MVTKKNLEKDSKNGSNNKLNKEAKIDPNKKWWENKYFIIAVIMVLGIIAILIINECNKDRMIQASIYCPNMNKYESDEGIYNANNFSLGTVLLLDLKNLEKRKIRDVIIPKNSLLDTDTTKFNNQKVTVDFDIKLVGSLNKEKIEKIKAELSSEAKQTFNFSLYNYFRRNAINAIDIANNDSALLVTINEISHRIPDSLFVICFVSGLVYADSLRIEISDMNKLNIELQTEIDSIKVNYSYSCEGKLFTGGNSSPLFWKAQLMDYSKLENRLIPHIGPIIKPGILGGNMTLTPNTLSISEFNFKEKPPDLK